MQIHVFEHGVLLQPGHYLFPSSNFHSRDDYFGLGFDLLVLHSNRAAKLPCQAHVLGSG